eukprot:symbB.v1.2.023685.t1/scaffold2172.1/size87052/4
MTLWVRPSPQPLNDSPGMLASTAVQHQSPQPSPLPALLPDALQHMEPAMARHVSPQPSPQPLNDSPGMLASTSVQHQSPQLPSPLPALLPDALQHMEPAMARHVSPQFCTPQRRGTIDSPGLGPGEPAASAQTWPRPILRLPGARPSPVDSPLFTPPAAKVMPSSPMEIQPYLLEMMEMQQRQLQLLQSLAEGAGGGAAAAALPMLGAAATEPLEEQIKCLRDAVLQQSQMLHHLLQRPEVEGPSVPPASGSGPARESAVPVVHQLGHLQHIEERLQGFKAAGAKDAHQVYHELLQLQDLQRQLQQMDNTAAQVGSQSSIHRTVRGAPQIPQSSSPGSSEGPIATAPRLAAGAGDVKDGVPQWGDLQLQLHEQLETLRQKQRSQTLEAPCEAAVSESQAEFMKRQQDSLAERLIHAGFIPDLGLSGSTRPPASGRHESEDTEQPRDSETPASPELFGWRSSSPPPQARPSGPAVVSGPFRRPSQRPEYFQLSPETPKQLEDSTSHAALGEACMAP